MFVKIKDFVITNFDSLRKFWVNQLVSSFLGLMVTWAMAAFSMNNDDSGIFPELIAGIFCAGFFCFLIYDNMFQLGSKDYIRVNRQGAEKDVWKPVKIIVFAYIPTIILAVLGFIFYFADAGDGYAVISIIMNMVVHSMYSGFFRILPDGLQVYTYAVSILFTIGIGTLGYELALHDRTLRSLFGIKVKVNKE